MAGFLIFWGIIFVALFAVILIDEAILRIMAQRRNR